MRARRTNRPAEMPRKTAATLPAYLNRWLRLNRLRWKPATVASYGTLVRAHVVSYFLSRKISTINTTDVKSWQRDLKEQGVGASVRRRAQQVVAQALNDLVRAGGLNVNAFAVVPPPKSPRSKTAIPTMDDLRRLLNASEDPQVRAMILLAATSMLRFGEMLDLKVGDVDLKRKIVMVSSAVSPYPTRRGGRAPERSKREFALPRVAIVALRAHLRSRGNAKESAPLFVGRSGKPFEPHNFRNRVWIPLVHAARLQDVHFDALRHLGTAILLESGIDPSLVAERARLMSTRMLERHAKQAALENDDIVVKMTDEAFADLE